ncbi:MAG: P-loop NTPase fold protein, partial [Bulleidia sp.]
MAEEERKSIVSTVSFPTKNQDEQEITGLAIYYDAWENDNDTDPVLSLVYEITKQSGLYYQFDDDSNFFRLAGVLLEEFTGWNIKGIIENLKSKNLLASIKEEKDLHDKIGDFFAELLHEKGERLVVFIDELDRCKPTYAVQLLERIKHYFNDDRITFVFSVNLSELQHTIKNYYGNTFDACRYLDRFFDLRLSLPPADKTEFYRNIGLESTYSLEKICRKVIDTYDMELREVIRFYRQVKIAVYEPTHDSRKFHFSFPDGKGRHLLLIFVVLILIGLKIVDISLYDQFVSGKNSKPLMDIYYIGKNTPSVISDSGGD